MNPIIWLVLLIVFIVIELITLGLTTIWFAGGSLAAYLISLTGANEWIQIGVFIVVSFVLLIFTRPLAQKVINKGTVKTNVEAIAGKTAKVIEEIDNVNATGKAILEGEKWMARSTEDAKVIPVGEYVTVVEVKGVKLIVKKKEEN